MPLSYDARSVFSLFSMKYMGSCPLNRNTYCIPNHTARLASPPPPLPALFPRGLQGKISIFWVGKINLWLFFNRIYKKLPQRSCNGKHTLAWTWGFTLLFRPSTLGCPSIRIQFPIFSTHWTVHFWDRAPGFPCKLNTVRILYCI